MVLSHRNPLLRPLACNFHYVYIFHPVFRISNGLRWESGSCKLPQCGPGSFLIFISFIVSIFFLPRGIFYVNLLFIKRRYWTFVRYRTVPKTFLNSYPGMSIISVIIIFFWFSGIRILILPVLIMRIRIQESHISADPSGSRTLITSIFSSVKVTDEKSRIRIRANMSRSRNTDTYGS